MQTKPTTDNHERKRKLYHNKGPLGLGDPDDYSLTNVEKDVGIPKKMEQKVAVHCSSYMEALQKCRNENRSTFFHCRPEKKAMTKCIEYWNQNPEFIEAVTREYLLQRAEYRRTGLNPPTPQKFQRTSPAEALAAKQKQKT